MSSGSRPTSGSWAVDARALLDMGAELVDRATVEGLFEEIDRQEAERAGAEEDLVGLSPEDLLRVALRHREWWRRWQRWGDVLCRRLRLHPENGLLGDDGMRTVLAGKIVHADHHEMALGICEILAQRLGIPPEESTAAHAMIPALDRVLPERKD